MCTLLRHGVYLSVDEFKGRWPVSRGSSTIAVEPTQLRNPASAYHVPVRSSGSRGGGTPVPIDLAFLGEVGLDIFLALEARGGAAWQKGHWQVPGSGVLTIILIESRFGPPPVRWFSQVDPATPGLHPRYRWSARVLRWGGRLAGVPIPRPEYVPLENPRPIATWMATVLQAGGTPHLYTFPSSAVRLCQAATVAGIELAGAQFTVMGEPLTAARVATIRRSGAEVLPHYAAIECSAIGLGCMAPEAPDEVHLLQDLHALIQAGPEGEPLRLPPDSLFISSLHPAAPFILVNVSMGDQGVLRPRTCDCPLERLGWSIHLHAIRSYEKLTAGGMTFLDTDLTHVLEEVLPSRFGGSPTDYQLVEEEAPDGQPRLHLFVHPRVGSLDPTAITETFLATISRGSGVERVMGLAWRDAELLRVERQPPFSTVTGKILHLHLDRRPPAEKRDVPSERKAGTP